MTTTEKLRLGVNIDHVATVRNARGGDTPDPLRAARIAEEAGADGITAHLREDRRHISDADIEGLMDILTVPLNFEMAATEEMQQIALRHKPHAVCIVPEKREERTTEGGLEVAREENRLAHYIAPLRDAGCRVSIFIAADQRQIEAAHRIGAEVIELHSGAYCDAHHEGRFEDRDRELDALREMSTFAHSLGLEVHVGHGLTYETVQPVAAFPEARELNIGHFLIGEAIFRGLQPAMAEMRRLMDEAQGVTGTTTATDLEQEVMESINRWAVEIGATETGPAFTAAILHQGRELVRGRNTARADQDPTHHAEVVTIAKAAAALGRRNLSGCTLVSSCQPCEMCLAAMRWAGIDRVIFGARQEDIDAEMFRFPDLTLPQFHAACGGAFDYAGGVHDQVVLHLYRDTAKQWSKG